MAEPQEMSDKAVWRLARSQLTRPSPPDALALAAYAEGRLPPVEAEAVEAWLAVEPEALADVEAARRAAAAPAPAAEDVAARARALVSGHVVDLAARRANWRPAAASWGSLAAAVALVAVLGFELGSETYVELSEAESPAFAFEVFDGGFLTEIVDDAGE